MTGVIYALRDCVDIARAGLEINATNLCGGGARTKVWRQLVADVLNVDVYMMTDQGPSFGASILAMVGAGEYKDLNEATSAIIRLEKVASPDPEAVLLYDKKYAIWKTLYPALKDSFAMMK